METKLDLLPPSISARLDPSLQKYIDLPPGVGKSVTYAVVNTKDGKAYVGKHCHGKNGLSAAATRIYEFLNPKASNKTYKANAVRKHGKDAFVPVILWHGDQMDENENELFWISSKGLHTRRDDGGWGYNDRVGGDGGAHSNDTISRLKEFRNTPEYTAAQSARNKERFANETEDQRSTRIAKMKATMSDPEFRGAKSVRNKEWHANMTEEQRLVRISKMKATMSDPEYLAAASARAKEQFSDPEARAALSARAKKQFSDPEARAALSARAKKQMSTPEAIERQSTKARTWWETATTEQLNAMKAARDATVAESRKRRMENMTEAQKKTELAKQAKNERAQAKKRKILLGLRAIPGYEKATQATVAQLRKEGKLPRLD